MTEEIKKKIIEWLTLNDSACDALQFGYNLRNEEVEGLKATIERMATRMQEMANECNELDRQKDLYETDRYDQDDMGNDPF